MVLIVQGSIYRLCVEIVSFHLDSSELDFLSQTGSIFTRNFRVRIAADLDGQDFARYRLGSYFVDANRLKNFPEVEISFNIFNQICSKNEMIVPHHHLFFGN